VREKLQRVLEDEPDLAYAILFGSAVSRPETAQDVDIAIAFVDRRQVSLAMLGAISARLEAVAGRPADILILDEAPPGIAYRVFRDGVVLLDRDHRALVARRAKAVLEYLDFQPVEELLTRSVLAAASRGR
jgi:predicted nucleotidyltransferase